MIVPSLNKHYNVVKQCTDKLSGIPFNGKRRKRTVESGGQTRPYSRAKIENGRDRKLSEVNLRHSGNTLQSDPSPSRAVPLHNLRRQHAERRRELIAHLITNSRKQENKKTLDKHATSKYKDRLFEDGFAGIRRGGKNKGKRAPRWKRSCDAAKGTRHFREQETLVCKSLYRVGGSFYFCLILFPVLLSDAVDGVPVKEHIHTREKTGERLTA